MTLRYINSWLTLTLTSNIPIIAAYGFLDSFSSIMQPLLDLAAKKAARNNCWVFTESTRAPHIQSSTAVPLSQFITQFKQQYNTASCCCCCCCCAGAIRLSPAQCRLSALAGMDGQAPRPGIIFEASKQAPTRSLLAWTSVRRWRVCTVRRFVFCLWTMLPTWTAAAAANYAPPAALRPSSRRFLLSREYDAMLASFWCLECYVIVGFFYVFFLNSVNSNSVI